MALIHCLSPSACLWAHEYPSPFIPVTSFFCLYLSTALTLPPSQLPQTSSPVLSLSCVFGCVSFWRFRYLDADLHSYFRLEQYSLWFCCNCGHLSYNSVILVLFTYGSLLIAVFVLHSSDYFLIFLIGIYIYKFILYNQSLEWPFICIAIMGHLGKLPCNSK